MGEREHVKTELKRWILLSKRVKDIILGTLVYAGIGSIVTLILNGGEPVWTLVIGQGIAGFLIYAYIYPALERRKRKRI